MRRGRSCGMRFLDPGWVRGVPKGAGVAYTGVYPACPVYPELAEGSGPSGAEPKGAGVTYTGVYPERSRRERSRRELVSPIREFTLSGVEGSAAEGRVTGRRSQAAGRCISPLERTVTENASVSPLQSTLTKSLDLKSLGMTLLQKIPGGWAPTSGKLWRNRSLSVEVAALLGPPPA